MSGGIFLKKAPLTASFSFTPKPMDSDGDGVFVNGAQGVLFECL